MAPGEIVHQVEKVSPSRKFVGFALIDDISERGSLDLQQRAFGSYLYALARWPTGRDASIVSVLLYLHNHTVAGNVLEALFFEIQAIRATAATFTNL